MEDRFFMSTDGSGHWYVVPVDCAAEWEEWTDIPEDDERSWEVPDFAKPVGGAPPRVTFMTPVIL